MTRIEWTDATWNPTRGCSRVSEGCRHCYAERQAARFCKDDLSNNNNGDQPFYGFVEITSAGPRWTGAVELIESKLTEPLRWRKPKRVFVNSMSDLFHEALSDEAIDKVFAVMALCPQLTFQVLTKRAKRMRDYWKNSADIRDRWAEVLLDRRVFSDPFSCGHNANHLSPAAVAEGIGKGWRSIQLPNVWLGVSVEDQKTADERIPLLLQTPAALRFVSYEPALAPVSFRWAKWLPRIKPGQTQGHLDGLKGIDWVIIGGESGPGARACNLAWIRAAVEQCRAAGVPVFVKQLGAKPQCRNDNGFEGDTPESWPMGTDHFDLDSAWQGATVAIRLKDRKAGDMTEWPPDLRVREFPEGAL